MPQQPRIFWKLTGSGNDFVFFDARGRSGVGLPIPEFIREVCARGTGVGADGMVVLETSEHATARMRYFNSDGSVASLCGNAALCTVRLLATLDGKGTEVSFESDAGLIRGRLARGRPEVDLPDLGGLQDQVAIPLRPGERRMGFAVPGVPHIVVLVADTSTVDVLARGRELRHDPSLAEGANANFISARSDGRWDIRTFERGVEGETLACGTGAVAAAALLVSWELVSPPVAMMTRSGQVLSVGFRRGGGFSPSLGGEGRIVFSGELATGGA
ncbi:MAG: diaminopimelate epimerase [Gemmatimonadaceae bacterium]